MHKLIISIVIGTTIAASGIIGCQQQPEPSFQEAPRPRAEVSFAGTPFPRAEVSFAETPFPGQLLVTTETKWDCGTQSWNTETGRCNIAPEPGEAGFIRDWHYQYDIYILDPDFE